MSGILVALDFGPAHPAAVAAAADLARAFQLPVHLVHVRTPVDGRPEHAVRADDPDYARRLQRERRDLDNDILRLRALGLTASLHVPRGERVREILRLATSLKARYLVLGAREPSALRHLTIGSVPAEVLRLSPVPVVFAADWQRGNPKPE